MDILSFRHQHGRHPLVLLCLSSGLALLALYAGVTSAADREGSAETSRQNPIALSYYNLIITEYSYKFWAAFMVATLVILVYACLAAIWVSQTVYLPPPISYDEYDYFAKRSASEDDEDAIDPSAEWRPQSVPPSPRTTRRIFKAIAAVPPPTT